MRDIPPTVSKSLAAVVLSCLLAACGAAGAGPTTSSNAPGSTPTTTKLATSSTTTTTLPKLSLPLTVLEIGDSLGEDLGFGLSYEFANQKKVQFFGDAVGDTGLARPDYYDWLTHLATDLATTKPQVVVIFLGANDTQGLTGGTTVEPFGTAGWNSAYATRVGQLMSEATSAGARVIWVGMPVVDAASDQILASNLATMNGIYEREAAHHPGVTYLSSMSIFATPSGAFTMTKPGPSGSTYILRAPDGVHLANAGEDLLAALVVSTMNRLYGLHLQVLQPPVG
jgi:hypothetical protein